MLIISSLIPSLKNSCSGSLLMLAKIADELRYPSIVLVVLMAVANEDIVFVAGYYG
jgi:hypothetical protein